MQGLGLPGEIAKGVPDGQLTVKQAGGLQRPAKVCKKGWDLQRADHFGFGNKSLLIFPR